VAEAAPALVAAGQDASLPDGVTRPAPLAGPAVRLPLAALAAAAPARPPWLAWAAAGTKTTIRAVAVRPASQGFDPFTRLIIMIT
jgi:hypothetical protein